MAPWFSGSWRARVAVAGMLCTLLCTAPPATAAEWFADSASCPSPGSGTRGDPYCSLQGAVDASAAGDVVRAAPGRYADKQTRVIEVGGIQGSIEAVLFLKSGVAVVGSGPGESILDAGGAGTVVVADGCDAGASLGGFTLRGAGPGSSLDFDFGDGIFVDGGSPTLTDLEIEAVEGGFAAVDVLGAASPLLERVRIQDCGRTAPLAAAVLVSEGAFPTLRLCALIRNRGTEAGGAFVAGADILLEGCLVAANLGASGGGIRIARSAQSVVRATTVALNTSGVAGAGLKLESSSPLVSGSVIASNRSLSGQIGGVFADGESRLRLDHNDVHGNLDADFQSRLDPTGSDGNISQDPRFRDLQTLDLRLREGSPAIDSGPPAVPALDLAGASRPLDADRDGAAVADIGAYEFDRWEVRGVTAGSDPFTLVWSGLPEASGYRVSRGTLAEIAHGSTGACATIGGDLLEPRFEDPPSPAAGEGWFYLVAARVEGALGTLGFDSRGLERIPQAGESCP